MFSDVFFLRLAERLVGCAGWAGRQIGPSAWSAVVNLRLERDHSLVDNY